jgi:uncharacterized Zn-finger protein
VKNLLCIKCGLKFSRRSTLVQHARPHTGEKPFDIHWKNIKDAYLETGEKILGIRNNLQKDWMSEKTWE